MSPTRHVPSLLRPASLATLFAALLVGCTDEPQPTGPAAPRNLRPSMAAVASATNGKIAFAQVQKLIASDGAADDAFGRAVAVSGDRTVIGAFRDDDNGVNSGSAYVFERSGTSWNEVAKLIASDGAENDAFGISAAISGDLAIIGAQIGEETVSRSLDLPTCSPGRA